MTASVTRGGSAVPSSRVVLDLNLGSSHLMDIIEGPAGYGADSILIRYQAPCTIEEQDVEGDNLNMYLQDSNNNNNVDDNMTIKSTSTAGSSTVQNQQQHRVRRRRRRQLQRQLDDQVGFVMASIERFATQFKHLSLRFVGCSFPADALAWLLERVDRIESLQLRVTFHGSLTSLARALKRHPRLSQITLDHCRPSLEDLCDNSSSSNNGGTSKRRRQHQYNKQEDDEYKGLDKSSTGLNKNQPKLKTAPPKLASLEPLLDGLAQSKTLRSLTLSHTTIAFMAPIAPVEDVDPLLAAAAAGPITTSSSSGIVAWNAGASLAQFVRMASLERMSLEHMAEVGDADLATMAAALEANSTGSSISSSSLKTLSIRQCAVGPLAGKAMGKMLAVNRTLQTLDINIHWWDGLSYEETTEGQYIAKCWETDVASLIEGLQSNASLKCLGLYCDNLAYTHNAAVVSILGEYVEASTNRLCATALEALPKIFFQASSSAATTITSRTNRMLEDVIVGHRSYGLTPEIEFYLNWNRAGRDYFCQEENASRYDWIDAFLNHREDLSVVYALVSMNPAMFYK